MQRKINVQPTATAVHHLAKLGPTGRPPRPRLDGSPGNTQSKDSNTTSQQVGYPKYHSSRTENSKETGSNSIQIRKMMHEAVRYTFKHEIVSLTGFHPEYEKKNQDNARYYQFLSNKEIVRLYILADGHGNHGREASDLATELVIAAIERGFGRHSQSDITDEQIHQIINNAFDSVQNHMVHDEERRFRHSGTTMVLAVGVCG